MKYDAIVVGGGIAGLTPAAYLAKAGQSVILFEKQAKLGGQVQTFHRNNVYFDGGLRSIENSGIVFPMLRQLGIDIEFKKSNISIGIANDVLKLKDKNSIVEYEAFLISHFPEDSKEITDIIKEIKKIIGYMDVLYGFDNPALLDLMKHKKYLMQVIMPWIFKFLFTIRKINKLNEPVEDYLRRFTSNQALIDVIARHFFQKAPTSFALSYFSLYLDYHYPKGGTATLIEKMTDSIVRHAGTIKKSETIEYVNPEQKFIKDTEGNRTDYTDLIRAGDMKHLYDSIPLQKLKQKKLISLVQDKGTRPKNLRGGDSVFTVYVTVNENNEYFSNICTGHFFYTPDKKGLSSVSKKDIDAFINSEQVETDHIDLKAKVKQYLKLYFQYNPLEIAIPVLRDPDLAPEGKVGVVISLQFDYRLSKKIDEFGWTDEMRIYLEQISIDIMDKSIFPGFKDKILEQFSSSPLTIEKLTGNTEGGITGWAFTNPDRPVVTKMLKVSQAIGTQLPSIYQAGQLPYSPSGLPVSILTGKLAADKALKDKLLPKSVATPV